MIGSHSPDRVLLHLASHRGQILFRAYLDGRAGIVAQGLFLDLVTDPFVAGPARACHLRGSAARRAKGVRVSRNGAGP
ncbi:TPA: hypothetical protein DCY65_03485 [Candidatus Acetothermia bacterium]|nr:hypothetical protein [Candidatus Acetothermia bacterium]